MGQRAESRPWRTPGAVGAALLACVLIAASCATSAGGDAQRPTAGSALNSTVATTAASDPTSAPGAEGTRGASGAGGRLAAPSEPEPPALQIRSASLTSEDGTRYAYLTGAQTVTAAMPPEATDGNIREVFWLADTQPARDAESCISWAETADPVVGNAMQPGLAMRIASVGPYNEGLRAITVTVNVVFAGSWLFNVHVWDTRSKVPMTLLETFDVSGVVGRIANVDGRPASFMVEPPWHLCGRTQGSVFSFKVWTQNDPEPGWDDADHVFDVFLPPGWDHVGYSGGYIGHLHPGQAATATPHLDTERQQTPRTATPLSPPTG